MNLTLIQAYSGVQGYEGLDNWTPRPPGTLTLNPEGSCHSLNTSVANSNGVTGVQVLPITVVMAGAQVLPTAVVTAGVLTAVTGNCGLAALAQGFLETGAYVKFHTDLLLSLYSVFSMLMGDEE